MGGQLDKNPSSSHSIKTYFDELFAYFLSIGMSSKEFWEDDVELVNSYYKAEQIRQTKLNNQLWIQGIYFQMAIASCFSKGAKYPKQPLPMSQHDVEEAKQVKVEKLKNLLKAKSKK